MSVWKYFLVKRLDTQLAMSVHKTFKWCPWHCRYLLNVLCAIDLHPVSRGEPMFKNFYLLSVKTCVIANQPIDLQCSSIKWFLHDRSFYLKQFLNKSVLLWWTYGLNRVYIGCSIDILVVLVYFWGPYVQLFYVLHRWGCLFLFTNLLISIK